MTEKITRRDFLKLTEMALLSPFLPNFEFSLPNTSYPEVNHNYFDVLDEGAQSELAIKSSLLLTSDPIKAINIADRLRNSIFSSASNICGPLAADQLIGTVTYGVRPEDFWLANVRLVESDNGNHIFSRAFPASKFDRFDINEPILEFNFSSIKLQPGDFIYFKSGNGAGSDHMMTVARRDKSGVLWGVTNYPNQNQEFITVDVPIWDPKNPEKSFLKKLAKGENSIKFSSGQLGFTLFRLKDGESSAFQLFDHSEDALSLRKNLEAYTRKMQGQWTVMVSDLESGKVVAENSSNMIREREGVMDIPLAICVLNNLESKVKKESDLASYLKNTTYKGKSFEELIKLMLEKSDQDATGKLTAYLGEEIIDTTKVLSTIKVQDTRFSSRTSTDVDIQRMFSNLYNTNDKSILKYKFSHQFILNALSTNKALSFRQLSNFGVGVVKTFDHISVNKSIERPVVSASGVLEVNFPGILFPIKRTFFVSVNGTPKANSKNCSYDILSQEFSGLINVLAGYLKGPVLIK